jgi:hypothetical protein
LPTQTGTQFQGGEALPVGTYLPSYFGLGPILRLMSGPAFEFEVAGAAVDFTGPEGVAARSALGDDIHDSKAMT